MVSNTRNPRARKSAEGKAAGTKSAGTKAAGRNTRRPSGRTRRPTGGRAGAGAGGWRGAAIAGVLLVALAGGTGLFYGYWLGGGGSGGGGDGSSVIVSAVADDARAGAPVPAPSAPPAAVSPATAVPPAMVAPRPGPTPVPAAPPPRRDEAGAMTGRPAEPKSVAAAGGGGIASPEPARAEVAGMEEEKRPQVAAIPPAPPPPATAIPVVARPPQPLPDDRTRPAWQRFSVPSAPADGRPAIAVVIDDMGVDRRRSARIVALPGPLTLAWLPYARDLPGQTAAARSAGHELMVHLPMEPLGGADPGPNAMLTGLAPDELNRRLADSLSAFDGFVGVNNHMGSRFTQDRDGMRLVLAELERRGLLFLDSRTSGKSVGYSLARDLKMPAAGRDVFLDHDMSPAAVRASLEKVEQVARRQGYAVAIGHPHDVTAAALAEWLPGLEAKGLVLVPISALVRPRPPGF